MRIRWTEPAVRDLTDICDYIQERDGPHTAHNVGLNLYKRIERLARFPHLGRPGRKQGTRELVFSGFPFLAIYRIRAGIVEISRILHGAQKWP